MKILKDTKWLTLIHLSGLLPLFIPAVIIKNYKKDEIIALFGEILNLMIDKLFIKEEGAFSYFFNKSQTHYYGYPVSKGGDHADIHGTLLSMWAITMIQNLKDEDSKLKLIKP